jgi:hypothetical protein
MAWQYDAHRQCLTTLTDNWRLLVRQGRNRRTWRAAVTPLRGGVARIAPAMNQQHGRASLVPRRCQSGA